MRSDAAAVPGTIGNLQAALNGETNTRARYLACARKADDEGYASVARLFRAVARAEEIHAGNHAAVLRQIGVTGQATHAEPAVGTTLENLEAAIRGETAERDRVYPAFLARARTENFRAAENTFQLAMEAEDSHARLFRGAREKLGPHFGLGEAYRVCPVCGFTTERTGFESCPVCRTLADDFEPVR